MQAVQVVVEVEHSVQGGVQASQLVPFSRCPRTQERHRAAESQVLQGVRQAVQTVPSK